MTLLRLADNTRAGSLATRLRRRRFAFFMQLVGTLSKPIRLLDVGGTPRFWRMMGWEKDGGIDITLLNRKEAREGGFRSVAGDARRMPQFGTGEFDVVFSNSVIEHVGGWEDQARMAAEITRVGKRYFVQTPNRNFPIEPHFLLPGFQFLPVWERVWLLRHFNLPRHPRTSDPELARRVVTGIRLLDRAELGRLFPGANLFVERFGGLAKSFIMYKGFERLEPAATVLPARG